MTTDRLRRPLVVCCAAATMLEAAPAHAAEGLNLLPEPAVLVALLVLFALLVPVLNAVLFKPILRVLDEREQRIDGARRRAEELTRQAERTLQQYETSVREARTSAEAHRKQTLERAQRQQATVVADERGKAEQTLERTRSEVGSALAGARAELQSQARELAREVAARVLGRAL